jgi:hypothetical protein
MILGRSVLARMMMMLMRMMIAMTTGLRGDDGGEGSSSAKKPVYQRGMTRLPPRPDPAQRTLIAPDGEK